MKKIVILLSLVLITVVGYAQVPAGFASPKSNGFASYGYLKTDSAGIAALRDTSFNPKYAGTWVYWQNSGVDSAFWVFNGKTTGRKWQKVVMVSSSTGGYVLYTDTSAMLSGYKTYYPRAAISGSAVTGIIYNNNTGLVSVDTVVLATRLRVQKGIDSLGQLKKNISDTGFVGGYTTRERTKQQIDSLGSIVSSKLSYADTGRTTIALATGGSLNKVKDSLVGLIAAGGFGTVLNVSTTDGVGIISSVATPTSTPNISIRVDTGRATAQIVSGGTLKKVTDSLGLVVSTADALKLNISDTAAMLTPNYRRTITKITNSDLVNSTISGTALGSNLPALSFGTYLQSGALSYNGTTANTITTNATSSNLGSTLIARDINGDFAARNISASLVGNASSASTVSVTNDNTTNATMYPLWSAASSGNNSPKVSSSKITFNPNTGVLTSNFTGALTGNATTASTLQTPRTINGVAFDGSANISISASVDSLLSAGYGITGSPFDGSLGRTWVVDTTKIIPYTDTLASWGIASKAFVRSLASNWYTVTDITKSYKPIVWVDSVWIWRGRQYATQNVAVGYRTLPNNIYTPNLFSPYAGGDMNTALGYKALEENTDGRRNTAVGTTALNKTTTGNYNTAIGSVSMFNNITGIGNVGLGVQTLQYNTSGNYNTALGTSALLYNETADYNVAIGRQSMLNNTTGANNTVGGSLSMFTNTTGANNTVWGYGAGYSSTTGSYNSIYGSTTGYDLTTGSNNTFIGRNTGRGITTGSGNTIIGGQVTGLSSTLENYTIIADGVGNRRINVPASGNVLIGTTTDVGDVILAANGNIRAIGGVFVGTNVTMEGSGNYVDYRGSNYARFSSSDGVTQWGYIQHNGTDLVFNNDIGGGKFTFNKAATITGTMTADTIIKSGGTSAQILAANGSVITAGTNVTISGGLISASGSGGTVTSIATDATLQGGTITTSGTLKVDTVIMATRPRVQKAIDSLGASKQNLLSGTTNYLPKFTGTSTLGNSGLTDDGTTVTFNSRALSGTSATFTTSTSNTQLTVNGSGAIKSGINFASGGTTYGQIYFDNNAPYSMSVLQQYSTGSLILGTNNTANVTIANGGATTFLSSVTASSFIKSGGTSSQLLAADGSSVTAGSNISISGGTISATGLSSGTVTSVATNNASGITGGAITTTGTLAIDTVIIATRPRVQKGIDSVAALIPIVSGYKLISDTLFNGGYTTRNTTKKIADSLGVVISTGLATKVNISDTATMLTNYRTGIIALNADTATLTARFTNQTDLANSKVAISDTTTMLSGYKTYYPRAALSAGTGISYNVSTGVITNTSTSSGGTVTSVATNNGSGITGGTFTTSGTIAADTTVLSTKANVTASLLGKVSSVSGTTNRITSTGGATPVIDISASYIGQSSITTVGTLSSGSIPYSLLTGTPSLNYLPLSGGTLTGALTGTSATFTDLYSGTGNFSAPIYLTGTTAGAGSSRWIGSDGASGLFLNVPTGNVITLGINNGNAISINGTAITLLKPVGGTSASFSGVGYFSGATTFAGLGGGISVNAATGLSSGVVHYINNVAKAYTYATSVSQVLESVSGVDIKLISGGVLGLTVANTSSLTAPSLAGTGDRMVVANSSGVLSASTNATVSGSITASSFIKSGGTSSQFLMADGSSNSTSYLPLTGGTITASTSGIALNITNTNTSGTVLYLKGGTSTSNIINAADDGGNTRLSVTAEGVTSTLRLKGIGGTTSVTAGGGAGTSPTISVTGTDMAGQITVTTGTSPLAAQIIVGLLYNTTFSAYSGTPYVTLTPTNANAAAQSTNIYLDTPSTTGFNIKCISALAASTTYTWNYMVIQ